VDRRSDCFFEVEDNKERKKDCPEALTTSKEILEAR
jgi:hypothetical protein